MLQAKWFYFAYFAALAGLQPYFSLYFKQLGIPGHQIGILMATPPLVRWISAPLWGALADATRRHKTVLLCSIACACYSIVVLLRAQNFGQLMFAVLGYALFLSPVIPIVDSCVMEGLGKARAHYGRIRFWGTVGWCLMSPLMGTLAEHHGIQGAMRLGWILMLLNLFVAIPLPTHHLHRHESRHLWHDMRRLLTDRRWIPFLGLNLLGGICLGTIHSYRFLFVDYLHGSTTLMGWSMVSATVSEMLIMYGSARLLKRWGTMPLFYFATLMLPVRSLLLAAIDNPLWILVIELSHGITFGLMWIAGVAHAHHLAPAELKTTGQGLFTGILMGLSHALGSWLGGQLMAGWNLSTMYCVVALASLPGIILLIMLDRSWSRTERQIEPQD